MEPLSKSPRPDAAEPKLKIYFLPNLLTGGNLFCGFVALTLIVEADLATGNYHSIKMAMAFILLACIFDLFDGRVARMGGIESPFGREFDSLADLISFGVAPAFLVHRVVLRDAFGQEHPEWGWFIASIYLLCGAFRLARFNCLAAQATGSGNKDFLGFPIPSAAGLVASLTLLIIQLNEKDKSLGPWKWVPAAVLLFLSAMMVSTVKYPEFQVPRPALHQHLSEPPPLHPGPRVHRDLAGQNPLLRPACLLHRLLGLWLHSSPHLAPNAARD